MWFLLHARQHGARAIPQPAVTPQSVGTRVTFMRSVIAAAIASVVLAACGPADVSTPLATPTATPTTVPSTRSVAATPADESTPPPSTVPTARPSGNSTSLVVSEIEVGSYLEVAGNGLAVRAGPGTNHPLVSEFLLGREEPIETTLVRDEVRLSAGHVVQASLEPIIVDETVWVAVYNVPQEGQTREDTPIWRSVAPVPYSEIDFQLTWIAVAQPGTTFVELTDQPACSSCYGDLPVPVVVASGVGDGRIGPWINRNVAWITIAAASSSSTSTCEFNMVNQDGQPTFLNDPAVEYVEVFIPGVSPASNASRESELWLDVTGDCAWAAKVYVAQD
jgi:hypothetical protein